MKKLISILLFLPIMASCATPSKTELDAEVKRLCAIDGGIKVYETVKLPPDKFNQWGQVNFYKPTQGENALGPEYVFKWNMDYYHQGQPALNPGEISMRRDHVLILRKLDMKLMGEVIMYHRAGGDLPGPWMPSSYHCPGALEANEIILMNRIFIKSQGDKK